MLIKFLKYSQPSEDQEYADLITRQYLLIGSAKVKTTHNIHFYKECRHCFSKHDLEIICIRIFWWVYLKCNH